MKRRDVLAMLGTGAMIVAAPARTQTTVPIVGYLSAASATAYTHRVDVFRRGLTEAGYTEGQNVAIEFRWADGEYERLPELAAELLRHKLAVLVASAGSGAALAARRITSTVPVVFSIGSDPVTLGFATSLNRPGGNMTGVVIRALELEAKLLSLVRDLVPQAATAGILVNPANQQIAEGYARAAPQAERTFGMHFHILDAHTDQEIEEAFAALAKLGAGALIVGPDPFFEIRRSRLVTLAKRHALPTLYFDRSFVVAGGLASYGADLDEAARQLGLYAGKILGGAKPADMPIVQLTKIELVINLKTANALGLTIPQSLRLRADELIH